MAAFASVRKAHFAVLGALLFGAVLLLPPAAQASGRVRAPDGKTIVGAATTLGALDTTFSTAATSKAGVLAAGAGCWWELGPDGAVSGAVCGPVAYLDDPIGNWWQAVTVGYTPVAGGDRATLTLGAHGIYLPDGTRLESDTGETRIVDRPGGQGRVLPVGQATELSNPGVPMVPPTDGRLASYGEELTVTGVASTHAAGPSGSTVAAPPGAHLLVASITSQQTDPGVPFNTATPTDFSASLVVAGQTQPFSEGTLSAEGNGQVNVAMSVPDQDPSAELDLTEAGVTQRFDLVARRRVGTAYPAMYRAAASPWQTSGMTSGSAVYADAFGNPETRPVAASVEVGGFSWDDNGNPSAVATPSMAVAVVEVMVPNDGPGQSPGLLTPSAMHLSADGQPAAGLPQPAPYAALFDVPASATTFTVTADSGAIDDLSGTNTQPVTFTIPVPISPVASPADSSLTADLTAALGAEQAALVFPSAATHGSAGGATGAALPVGLAGLVALVVVALTVVVRRRHAVTPLAAQQAAGWQTVTAPAYAPYNPTPAPPPVAPIAHPDGASHPGAPPAGPPASGPPPEAAPSTPSVAALPLPEEVSDKDDDAPQPLLNATDSAAEARPEGEDDGTTMPPARPRLQPVIAPPADGLLLWPLVPEGTVVFRVLGPVGIDDTPDRTKVVELGIWLALRRGTPKSGGDVVRALRLEDDRDPQKVNEALRATARRLRALLGPERFPPAPEAGGYQLRGALATDLELLETAIERARANPDDALVVLAAGLTLVAGVPFVDVVNTWSWPWIDDSAERATRAIGTAAHLLADAAATAGYRARAQWAADVGLAVSNADMQLLQDLYRLSANPDQRRRAYERAVRAIGADEARHLLHP